MTWQRRAVGALLPWWLVSCGDPDLDLPPLRFETTHFRYHARRNVEVCDGLGAWLEHHYESVGGALGAELDAGAKFDIYVFSDLADMRSSVCHSDSHACMSGRSIYQPVPFVPHELIHAYVRLSAHPPTLFDEGLAFVLGCGPGVDGTEIERSAEAIRSALTTAEMQGLSSEESARALQAARGLVRFLIDVYGLDRVMTFSRAVARSASRPTVEQTFSSTFDVTLEDALTDWIAGPPQTESGVCLHLAECATENLTSTGTVDLAPACAYGVSVDGFLPWSVIRSLSVDDAAGVVVDADSLVIVAVRGCSVPLVPAQGDLLSPEAGFRQELWSHLGPGRYWLLVGASDEDFSVRVTTGPPLFADRCSEAPARPIASETKSVRMFGSLSPAADDDPEDGVPDLAATLEVTADRKATLFRFEGEARLCAGGCPADVPACSSNSVSTELSPGTDNRLVVQGADGGFAVRIDFSP